MPIINFLFQNDPMLEMPSGVSGWLGWLCFLGLNIYLLIRWWGYNQSWKQPRKWIMALLVILVPLTSLVFPAIQLSSPVGYALLNIPKAPPPNFLVIFGSVPWFLAAGLLGPAYAAALAAFSGLLIALWGTTSPFLPLELAILASWLGMLMYQNYRTIFFRILRRPILAAGVLAICYPFLIFFSSLLTTQGSLTGRLDFVLSNLFQASIAWGSSFIVAGIVSEIVMLAAPKHWGNQKARIPSPAESKLSARFLYGMVPAALILLLILVIGDWIIAGRVAQKMVQNVMTTNGETIADNAVFIQLTAKEWLEHISQDPRLTNSSPDEISKILGTHLLDLPLFSQLILVNSAGELIASYPPDAYTSPVLSQKEKAAIINRVSPFQFFSVRPKAENGAAMVSFITDVKGDGSDRLVLIGRSNLAENQIAKPLLNILTSLSKFDGEGMLIDEDQYILYHSDQNKIMTVYPNDIPDEPFYGPALSSDGTRQIVYSEPGSGNPWSVVLTVPARYAQEQALEIALPLLGVITLLFAITLLIFWFGLRLITSSMQSLAVEAGRMSRGQLDQPLEPIGEDEVGQLSRAFEQMRSSLKNRLDELNRLLIVSQGVASSLDIREAMLPVLESALVTGATSARVVLEPSVFPNFEGDSSSNLRLGSGPSAETFSVLDDQVVALTRKQDLLRLTNLTRPRLFDLSATIQPPQALLALALRNEDLFYGAFWVAYDQSHMFSDEEIRYITTLAGQAVIATSNARLFMTSELGRQRLEAILVSTPDPVLVTDQKDHLLLTNPAASKLLGEKIGNGLGIPISSLNLPVQLINLLHEPVNGEHSIELTLSDNRVYLANASAIIADGKLVGRVCILRDITQFRELDTLKSDFVSTVSHDLRSPLTLIRGYATMLQMVGELNDQQSGYLNKIMISVDNMSRLVNNLLDLGRIEAGVGLQLDKKPVDEVVNNVVGLLQLQATQKQIQLITEIPDQKLPFIEADQALLQQALYNLVENAIKYTDSGGKVVVGVNLSQNHIEYTVRDNGIGISPADQKRLFEKFYRGGRKGFKPERGTGLGLAIVKSIIERHGGIVLLQSQLGKGSKFTLVMPLTQIP